MSEEESIEKNSAASAINEDEVKKIKVVISEPADGPLTRISQTLKDRGIKNFDLNQLVSEAVASLPATFWEQKLDELTPLEYKLQQAMEDPQMREKIMTLLSSGSREVKGASAKQR